MPSQVSTFENSVFINCPFDPEFEPLLRSILFTIVSFNFYPKIASERSDSAEQRIEKISSFINESKFSIHDLSRLKSQKKNEFSRHNMPFELGIDYGCRKFGSAEHRSKKFLVLERTKYEYSRALSDLAGIDIKSHNNEPEAIIRAVRNWFVETVGVSPARPASMIFSDFIDFMADFDIRRRSMGFSDKDVFEMPIPEFIGFIQEWLENTRL